MITTIVAAWFVASIPVALVTGRLLRRNDPYPVFDPTPVDTIHRGDIMNPYPLGRAELQKIVDLFDPAALVVDEPLGGYTEVVFPDPDDAVHFALVGRGGYGAARFLSGAEVILRVPDGGPVTLGVTLAPAWRPVEVVS